MAAINVCDRTKMGKTTRLKLNSINLSDKVYSLKQNICKETENSLENIDLIYCGQALKDNSSIESYGLKSGCTLHVLPKYVESTQENKDFPSATEIKQIQGVLKAALANPAYRSAVDSLMNSSEALHNIVESIPGLDSDPSVLSLFQDPDLLLILIHPGNIRRVIEGHPSFIQVAKMVAAMVSETTPDNVRPSAGSNIYSLDQMSDDEEMPGGSNDGQRQGITANQLAAALAAATGSPMLPTMSPNSSEGAENQAMGPQVITHDFFQQAIIQAQSAAMQQQVEQMREMGITDENVARQALMATNGDLQAAIDLIFSGDM